jgi:hypothetical protein
MSKAKLPGGKAVPVVDVTDLQKRAEDIKYKQGELADELRQKRRYHEQQIAEIDALMVELGLD